MVEHENFYLLPPPCSDFLEELCYEKTPILCFGFDDNQRCNQLSTAQEKEEARQDFPDEESVSNDRSNLLQKYLLCNNHFSQFDEFSNAWGAEYRRQRLPRPTDLSFDPTTWNCLASNGSCPVVPNMLPNIRHAYYCFNRCIMSDDKSERKVHLEEIASLKLCEAHARTIFVEKWSTKWESELFSLSSASMESELPAERSNLSQEEMIINSKHGHRSPGNTSYSRPTRDQEAEKNCDASMERFPDTKSLLQKIRCLIPNPEGDDGAPCSVDEHEENVSEAEAASEVHQTLESATDVPMKDHPELKLPKSIGGFRRRSFVERLGREDRVMKEMVKPAAPGEGFVYIFALRDNPGFLKIGVSKVLVDQRRNQIAKNCGESPIIIGGSRGNLMKNCRKVEKLVHAALSDAGYDLDCKRSCAGRVKLCRSTHKEWFWLSPKRAMDEIHRWRCWIEREHPYESDSGELKKFWKDRIQEYHRQGWKTFGNSEEDWDRDWDRYLRSDITE